MMVRRHSTSEVRIESNLAHAHVMIVINAILWGSIAAHGSLYALFGLLVAGLALIFSILLGVRGASMACDAHKISIRRGDDWFRTVMTIHAMVHALIVRTS